jgi:hypothetical protein
MGASASWNPQGFSRPVMGLLYLLCIYHEDLGQNLAVEGLEEILAKGPAVVVRGFFMISLSPSQKVVEFYSTCSEDMTASFYSVLSIILCNSGEGGAQVIQTRR